MYSKSSLLQRTLIVTIALCCFAVTTAQVPTISGFSPTSGSVGTPVTISGTNFDNTPANNYVYFGTVKATVTTASTNSLTVTVPKGSTHQRISIMANGFTGQSQLPFATTFSGAAFIPAYFSLAQSMLPSINYKQPFVMQDMNNDGKPDIVGTGTGGQFVYTRNTSTAGNILFNFDVENAIQPGNGYPVTADWLPDGKPDVVVLHNTSNLVYTHKNITTLPNYFYSSDYGGMNTLANPRLLAGGDMDGDGKTDLAIAYSSNTNVSLFRNKSPLPSGGPDFATRLDFPVGFTVGTLILADIDADNRADLLVVNASTGTLSIYRSIGSAGTISFAPKVDIAIGAYRNAIVADLNSDGYPEILVCYSALNKLSLLRNNSSVGNISFPTADTITAPERVGKLAVDDLDGDGKPDIAAALSYSNGVSILKNTSNSGNLSFAAGVTYPTPTVPELLYISDVDADGHPDMVITAEQRPYTLRNNLNYPPIITVFSPVQGRVGDTVTITGSNFTGATAVSFGGSPFAFFTVVSDKIIKAVPGIGTSGDIVVTTPYGTTSKTGFTYTMPPVITGVSPANGPVGSTVTLTGNYFNPVAANNIVNLGSIRATVLSATANSIDVVVPPGAPNQHFSVTTGNRTAYSPLIFHTTFAGAGPVFDNTYFDTTQRLILANTTFKGVYGFEQGDLDGDGKADLAITMGIGSGTSISRDFYTLRNVSVGSNVLFSSPVLMPNVRPFIAESQPIVDMNADGKVDLIISAGDPAAAQPDLSNIASIYKNISTPGLVGMNNVLKVPHPSFYDNEFYTADFDGDGRLDLVAKSFLGTTISVFRNTTENDVFSFAPPITIGPAGQNNDGGKILLEDFDGDGRIDLSIGIDTYTLIFRNTAPVGSIAFAPSIRYNYSGGPWVGTGVFYCSDFDGDGKIDLLSTNYARNFLSLRRNISTSGNLAFDAPIALTINQTSARITIADLDGDGKPDIHASYSGNGGRAVVLKNQSVPGTFAFAAPVSYPNTGLVNIADWDNDGKPDMIDANENSRTLNIFRNTIGEPIRLVLCQPMGNSSITSNVTGTTYQWQVNTGSGFVNIANDAHYNNVDGPVLQLSNIPSDWYGYQYRCVTNTGNSYPVVLRFSNTWTGATNANWENPANWSCGAVPDANTEVVIHSGTVTINSNITVRSLKTNPTVTITVVTGGTLTVLQ